MVKKKQKKKCLSALKSINKAMRTKTKIHNFVKNSRRWLKTKEIKEKFDEPICLRTFQYYLTCLFQEGKIEWKMDENLNAYMWKQKR